MKPKISINKNIRTALFLLVIGLCLSSFVSSPLALVLGFVFVFLFGHPFEELNSKAVKILLKVAVVGLGFGMNITETLAAG